MTSPAVAKPKPADPATLPDNGIPAPFSLDISSILALLPDDQALDDWFIQFAQANMDSGYRFELDGNGRLWLMASESTLGWRISGNCYYDLRTWSDTGPGGLVFPGNALVRAPGRGRRAADAGWISPDQIDPSLPEDWQEHAIPFAPHFVVEIRSRSNTLESQRRKMVEWIDYGVALGWLIDPFERRVYIYRPDTDPVVLDDPETISGDPELPGFVFNVRDRVFDLQ